MGLFDSLKNMATSALRAETTKAVNNAVNNAVNGAVNGVKGAVGKGKKESITFTFSAIPTNVDELKAIPESSLDTPFKTTALAVLILCNFEKDSEATFAMLDYLNGPETVNPYTRQFITERLTGASYIPFSFFEGATKDNRYVPNQPYKITVSTTPYSLDEENWATMYVQSSGADSIRPIKLRKKPSTGQWFVNEIQCLEDIRIPTADDAWA